MISVNSFNAGWTTPLVVITFALPLTIITGSYVVLFATASQLMKADNHDTTTHMRREIRIAKTIFVIVSLFVVCWSPFIVLNVLYSYGAVSVNWRWFDQTVHITKALHYSNSTMNVFVYAVRSPDFKETFVKIVTLSLREMRERTFTVMSLKEKNDSLVRAHLKNPPKSESLTGSVTVVLTMDENDSDFNDNRPASGLGSRNNTDISRLTDEVFLTYSNNE